MQAKPTGAFRGFLKGRFGVPLLLVVGFLVVFATYVYVSPLLAIPAFLLVGLAAPIYTGHKRPRTLALSAVVILLATAPIATAVFTEDLLAPVGWVSSGNLPPDGYGGSVLQNATVSPFVGSATTNFSWNVTVHPQHLPRSGWTVTGFHLYVSTCPGAIDPNASYCSPGYPLHTYTLAIPNLTRVSVVYSNHTIGSDGLWTWQMALSVKNNTSGGVSLILLVGDQTFDSIEGPVVGGFATVFAALLPSIFLDTFLYLGAPFFFILLLYMIFKNRERRRKEAQQRVAGPIPPSASDASSVTPAPSQRLTSGAEASKAAPAPSNELTCPNCNAVVYPAETKCWKCGSALPARPDSALPGS